MALSECIGRHPASAETLEARAGDEQKIRRVLQQLATSWRKGDAAAYATAFTEDSDYVTFAGERLTGQLANAEVHDALFSSLLQGTKLAGEVENIRFLTDDVAVVHGTGAVLMPWQHEVHPRRRSMQTYVFVRRYGAWRITAFQNTRIRPMSTTGPMAWLMASYLRLRRSLQRETRP